MSARILSALALLAATAFATPATQQKSSCAACDPQGIKTLNTPAYGPDLGPMFNDLVTSVHGIHFLELDGRLLDKRSAAEIEGRRRLGRRDPPPLCCELAGHGGEKADKKQARRILSAFSWSGSPCPSATYVLPNRRRKV
jgi:hypothetical protein